ncbi:MAG: hypothetical protein CVU97_02940 [Firmicutes bacterium HGW-Firmicutes-21]|nr:MAG: hypothetical protein CVU97_02940 [Firmicutes bacterium HGW-Firmicutes-21]
MGFGIATLGYGFMLTSWAGGGIFASLILAYGFFLASRFDKRFLAAAISALFMFPYSLLLILNILNRFELVRLYEIDENALIYKIFYSVFLLAWTSMSYYYFTAVKQIAIENSNKKLENKAMNRLYLTMVFLLGAFSLTVFGDIAGPAITLFFFVLQYFVIIINTMFLHTCFILITTESQYKKDKRQLIEEEKKRLEKRNKKE